MQFSTVAIISAIAAYAVADESTVLATEDVTTTATIYSCAATHSSCPYSSTAVGNTTLPANGSSNYTTPAVSVGEAKAYSVGTNAVLGAAALAGAVLFGL